MKEDKGRKSRTGQPWDIYDRTYVFGIRILKLVRVLPHDTAGWVLGRQVARSGTSIGSNAEEAKAAHSRREFILKMNNSRKEARETHYWLRLIRDVELVKPTLLGDLIGESEELVKILTAVVKKSRENL